MIRETTDAMGVGNRSDPVNRTTKPLVRSGPPIESAPAQSQDDRSQDQQAIRARKLGSIVGPRELRDLNHSVRAWRAPGETMTRGKSGEGRPSDHRNGKQPTTVNREGLNSLRVWRDREGNLEDLLHPIRDKIDSRLPTLPGKDVGEATVAIRRGTGTEVSAVISCRRGFPAAENLSDNEDMAATKESPRRYR